MLFLKIDELRLVLFKIDAFFMKILAGTHDVLCSFILMKISVD